MSDLRPIGIPIELGGVERHFLFTLNAIDAVQSHYNMPVLDAFNKMFDAKEQTSALKFLTMTLINDEVEREKWKNPDSELKEVTEKEVGWMIHADNIGEVTAAILAANRVSIPESDENDDPNMESGQQNS